MNGTEDEIFLFLLFHFGVDIPHQPTARTSATESIPSPATARERGREE